MTILELIQSNLVFISACSLAIFSLLATMLYERYKGN